MVVDGVCCLHYVLGELDRQRLPSLGVRFVERRSRAGDSDADTVPFVEDLTDPSDRKRQLIDLSGFHERLAFEAIAIAGSPRIVHDQD